MGERKRGRAGRLAAAGLIALATFGATGPTVAGPADGILGLAAGLALGSMMNQPRPVVRVYQPRRVVVYRPQPRGGVARPAPAARRSRPPAAAAAVSVVLLVAALVVLAALTLLSRWRSKHVL